MNSGTPIQPGFEESSPLESTKISEKVNVTTGQSFSEQDTDSLESDSNALGKSLEFLDGSTDETSKNKGKKNVCHACPQSFNQRQSLTRHVKRKHLTESAPEKVPKSFNFSCEICGNNFSTKWHYMFHKRNKHGISEAACRPKKLVPCTYCEDSVERRLFIDHLFAKHNKTVQKENMKFPTFDHFIQWKEDFEKKSRSKFVKERGGSTSGSKTIHNFYCHRSGFYVSKGKGIRRLKLQGSSKMNRFCPASMRVTIKKEGDCEVCFNKTHIGHADDMGHYKLTADERLALSKKIADEVPFDDILDEVRDSVTDSKSSRTHLLAEQDLSNLSDDFKSSADVDDDGAVGVEAWADRIQGSENSGLLYYKPRGAVCHEHPAVEDDDFFLAVMNDAQAEILQKYGSDCVGVDVIRGADGFGLVTLLVMDVMRQAFPCAFLISNKCDEAALKIFYSHVLIKCGKLSPRAFMSDVEDCFYDAWIEVHSLPEKRLHCSWLVDRAWRENLGKIKDNEKQIRIYKMLSALLEELDKDAFEKMFVEHVNLLISDYETTEFGEYIRDQFATCKTSWAYCHRIYSELNANMHFERMHKTLKYIYDHGETVKRLDISIHAIMKFVRDKVIDRLFETEKCKLTTRLRNITHRHKTSTQISRHVIKTGEGWTISSNQLDKTYVVMENNLNCKFCSLICNECKSCIHKYTCSCPDSVMQWNMCKHIHFICKWDGENGQESEDLSISNDNDIDFAEVGEYSSESQEATKELNEDTHSQRKNLASLETLERRISLKRKVGSWIDTLSTPDEFEAFEKLITPIPLTLEALQYVKQKLEPVKSLEKKPLGKTTDQRRSFSPKRKVNKKTNTKKTIQPTTRKSTAIPLILRKS